MAPSDSITSKIPKPSVLVTGATGFLGKRLTRKLIEKGYRTRALVRKSSDPQPLAALGAEISFGDVRDGQSLFDAMQDIDAIVHAAADTQGNLDDSQQVTVRGTRNVVREAQRSGIAQLVYISTCNVYGISECKAGATVDEAGPLEKHPELRGIYTHAKFKAEEIIIQSMNQGKLGITCLRPGTIWGPGGELFTPMMGFRASRNLFCIIGDGRFVLPLVHIDNLIDAIIKTIQNPTACNKIYNVVDPQKITKQQYANRVLKRLYPKAFFFYFPYAVLYLMVGCQEFLFKAIRRDPVLTRYRLTSSQRSIVYDAGKIRNDLNWSGPVQFEEALSEIAGSTGL